MDGKQLISNTEFHAFIKPFVVFVTSPLVEFGKLTIRQIHSGNVSLGTVLVR